MYEALYTEGRFMTPGIGYDPESGLTYDGYAINPTTLLPVGTPRAWSSPVKEALHLHTLALVLSNNSLAQHMLSASIPVNNQTAGVLSLLEKKLASYKKFNTTYPGFGGYLPWFVVQNGTAVPAPDWKQRVPGLDNGMFFWSIYHLYNALIDYTALTLPANISARATVLKTGFANIHTAHKTNLDIIFYEGSGKVRGVTKISNTTKVPTRSMYSIEG
jgi:hypothetical protein